MLGIMKSEFFGVKMRFLGGDAQWVIVEQCGVEWGNVNIMIYNAVKGTFSELSPCASVVNFWLSRQHLTKF